MSRVLDWHVKVGGTALRWFCLHLLWLIHTLLGGVVLGVFPATSALIGVLRRDVLDGAEPSERASLPREFHQRWRSEWRSANKLGLVLVGAWSLIVYLHWWMGANPLPLPSLVASGITTVVLVLLALVTTQVWLLQAHFSDRTLPLIGRSLILLIAKPGHCLILAAAVALTGYLYVQVPGVAAVFGLSIPAYLTIHYLLSAGILRRPMSAPTPEPESVIHV